MYYGNIDTSGAGGEDSVTVDTKLIQYPLFSVKNSTHNRTSIATAICDNKLLDCLLSTVAGVDRALKAN